jgi:uracil-DNA glycosylase
MSDELPDDWKALLAGELASPWYAQLCERVARERAAGNVYPPTEQVFAAFRFTPLEKLRVVLLGQDPYHGEGQAHGLAFSVPPGVKPPPSLKNIFKELASDVGCTAPSTGCLEPWARQGILLLNTALTVREGEAGSHAVYGWEKLTDAVIRRVSARPEHTVFVLWGGHARKKAPLIDTAKHTLIEGAHPSPLSQRLWFGSRPFSKIDAALKAHGQPPIAWQL